MAALLLFFVKITWLVNFGSPNFTQTVTWYIHYFTFLTIDVSVCQVRKVTWNCYPNLHCTPRLPLFL